MLSKMQVGRFGGVCLATGFAVLSNFSFLLNGGHNRAIAQEYPGCFMVDPSGNYMDLSNFCQGEKPIEDPIVMNGIMVNGLELNKEGSSYYIEGLIKNVSTEPQKISFLDVQIEEKSTNVVLGSSTIDIGGILMPGQSRSVKSPVEVNDIKPGRNRYRVIFLGII